MTTAEYIGYYHGTILGSVNNVYLVHYGDAEAVYYGIGSMVHNRKNDEEYPSFRTDDITNPFWKERLETLQAHPELIAEYVNPKYYDYLIPLPLDESNLAVLTERIKQNHADWKFQTIYPDFVIVKRTQQIYNDRYAVVTYRVTLRADRRSGMKRSPKKKRKFSAAISMRCMPGTKHLWQRRRRAAVKQQRNMNSISASILNSIPKSRFPNVKNKS